MDKTLRRVSIPMSMILLILASCSSTQIKTGHDPQADFTQYKTYTWAPQAQPAPDRPASSILDETVKTAVEQQLATKGLRKVPGPQADLMVTYSATTTDKVTYGAAPGPWYWGTVEQPYVTPEGSLTLQFIDPKNHRTVWQGTATDTVGDSGASQKQVANAVKDLLQKYPTA